MEPKVFIGREKEIESFKTKLGEAEQGRFNHYVILGEWGIGYDNGLNPLDENIFNNMIREASEKEKEIVYVLSHFDAVSSLDQRRNL